MGRPYEVKCTVSTKNVINSDNVSINWIGHNGAIANDSSRITVIPTTSDGYTHTSTLRFSYISEEDENTSYNCTASLFATETIPKSFNISNLNSKLKYYRITCLKVVRLELSICIIQLDLSLLRTTIYYTNYNFSKYFCP